MPEGKQFIKDFLSDKSIKRILDVGPGSGNYYDLLTKTGEYENYPGEPIYGIEWVAVEIFEPYIEIFKLTSKYNEIIISDIYHVSWDDLGYFDVVILGDVIEHMSEDRAKEVIKNSADHATWVILSLPIVDYPQEASWGNIHETHVAQYYSETVKDNLLKNYTMIDYKDGAIIGTYIFTK